MKLFNKKISANQEEILTLISNLARRVNALEEDVKQLKESRFKTYSYVDNLSQNVRTWAQETEELKERMELVTKDIVLLDDRTYERKGGKK